VQQEHRRPVPAAPESDAVSPAGDQRLALVNPFPCPGYIHPVIVSHPTGLFEVT
jgi:hypothetical protein